MSKRRFWGRFVLPVPLLAVVLTVMVCFWGITSVAQAAPKAPSPARGLHTPAATFSPPKEGAKVTLGETSIDGPAITATYAPATALAWAGTDAAHHLNLLTSTDGLHYSHKLVLPESSSWRPALAFIDSGRGAPYGTIVLAWTGMDPVHTLNLEFISTPDFVVREKITYWGETSFTAPAVATINGDVNSDVYLALAGNDSAHSLNVIHHTTAAPETNKKVTLWGWSSISRPTISHDQSPDSNIALLLAWTGVNNHLYFAQTLTTAATQWTMPSTSPLAQQSAWAPSLIAFYATNMPTYWLAWTGSGTASTHQISVEYTQHYPSWSDANATTVLNEAAMSSPQLAFNAFGSTNRQVLLAWTGMDPTHRLNVAVVYVTNS